MNEFGFFPGEPATPQEDTPAGHGIAGVRIADLHETTFCSLSTWNLGDYLQHWTAATQACLSTNEIGLFCIDLAPRYATAFVGFPTIEAYEFEEHTIPRRQLALSGTSLWHMKPPTRYEGASVWIVSLAAMRRFVSAGVRT